MKRVLLKSAVATSVLVAVMFAATPVFQAGKIVKVENKTRSRVLYYLVNTPVTAEDPYYEIEVRLKDTDYLGEYEPLHSGDAPPSEWTEGTPVLVRIDKRHMIIKNSTGTDFTTTLIRKRAPAR